MQEYKKITLIFALIFIFLVVYSPHQSYKLPYHTDEWHHITEAIKLKSGDYSGGTIGYRVGFHFFLMILSFFIDLVLYYQFLPALMAVISALILFYVTNKLTKNYWISLFAMFFFASLKSNINIGGLWFFTPLTFAIPLIYLFVYFFTQGLEKENKKYILISLGIIISLIFIHSLSFLFAIPFLTIYSLTKYKYLKKEWKFFSTFLVIPIIGFIFYSLMTKISLSNTFSHLINSLKFEKDWDNCGLNNSFFELYSFIGYALAAIGAVTMFMSKNKKYLPYLLWPITILISIFIYNQTGISYLTPYQRNLYYFAISMPFLSAFGLYHSLIFLKPKPENEKIIKTTKKIMLAILIIIVFALTFKGYYDIPESSRLYTEIDQNEYNSLIFLSKYSPSTVMAHHTTSTAIYPVSGHNPVGTSYFYGNKEDTEKFFISDCETKQEILDKHNVSFVLSDNSINCGWELIYDKNNYIYEIK